MELATVAELGTAAGTLVLAVATFASVRSANQAARTADESLREGLRPLLLPTRVQDPAEKVGFMGDQWFKVDGGQGLAQANDDVIFLAIPMRNVGRGLAVLHGWQFVSGLIVGATERPDPARFRRLTRDLYIPAGDQGFWEGAFRDPSEPGFHDVHEQITGRNHFTIDVLYGDYAGGQRMISRFAFVAHDDDRWLVSVSRHWNVDRPDPR